MNFKPPYPNAPNEIMDCGEFFISYNSSRQMNSLDDILIRLGQIKEHNLGRPETAIVYPDSNKPLGRRHLILYGDYREVYASIAHQGLAVCIATFEKHLEHIADTSDTIERTLS